MRHHATSLLLAAIALTTGPVAALAAKTGTIYNFTGGADGATPITPLTEDVDGNIYGTTQQGGGASCGQPGGCGAIFKLDKLGALTPLYGFANGSDGRSPGTGVALIRGVLYGNSLGGAGDYSVLYSINTDGTGFTVLHNMTRADGAYLAGLMQPSPSGGEFGLGRNGGARGDGTLFYLSATNTLFVAHDFAGGADGHLPNYLVEDSNHTLFGSTAQGGTCVSTKPSLKSGCGTIFEYVPSTRTYSVLYSFQNGTDGYSPLIGAVGADGTLYGVATQGGAYSHGVLFALTPGAKGYAFSVLSPIIDRYVGDYAVNPPALSPSGALVGATGSATYTYQNGTFSIDYLVRGASSGQYLVPNGHPDAFLGTVTQGGITGGTCPLVNGCGYIYYGRQ